MLLPVLKRRDWPGLDTGMQAHVWIGTTEDPRVLVAYVERSGGQQEEDEVYVSQTAATLRGTALLEDAFANLEDQHSSFEAIETGGHRLLLSMGPGVVTDRAMLQSHMLLAHEKLEAAEIVVSIPRAGVLVVADRWAEPPVRRALLDAHHRGLHDGSAEGDLLFEDLIVMADGWPTGTITAEQYRD
jgi:hypothetical protein